MSAQPSIIQQIASQAAATRAHGIQTQSEKFAADQTDRPTSTQPPTNHPIQTQIIIRIHIAHSPHRVHSLSPERARVCTLETRAPHSAQKPHSQWPVFGEPIHQGQAIRGRRIALGPRRSAHSARLLLCEMWAPIRLQWDPAAPPGMFVFIYLHGRPVD